MNEIKELQDDYFLDEFGRIIIQNLEILEQINGAGDFLSHTFFSNNKCGSNGACANGGCKR